MKKLGPTPLIDATATVERCELGRYTEASAYFPGETDEAAFFDRRRSRPVAIGHDVWIGHGAIILAGRNIGDGAVIAAGSVVTADIPPYSIAAGVPARVKKLRFAPKIAERIAALAWWDWDHEKLHAALDDFRCLAPDEFPEKFGG